MANMPMYQQISPDKDKIIQMNRTLGESAVQLLSERARTASIELYSLKDEQEKINQIYRFLYYYLLSYEYSKLPSSTPAPDVSAEFTALRQEHEELMQKFEELNSQYMNLLMQGEI